MVKKYSIQQVFEYIDASPKNGQRVDFDGDLMYLRTAQLLNFRVHGIKCVKCGTRGAFFAKEEVHGAPGIPHLHLYGFGKNGNKVLITRDHIKPISKGGSGHLYNLQPMCKKCNNSKSNVWALRDKLKYMIRKIKYSLYFESYTEI